MNKRRGGFTIIELLIVIVIIAILAAITIVAYNGITAKANDSVVQSDLHSVWNKLSINTVTDNTAYCTDGNIGWLPTIDAGCMNSSSAFNLMTKSDYATSGSAAMVYYLMTDSNNNPVPTIVALSKSGRAYTVKDGAVSSISVSDFNDDASGTNDTDNHGAFDCGGGYATWSASTATWTAQYKNAFC